MRCLKELYRKYMMGVRFNYFPLLKRRSAVPCHLAQAIAAVDALLNSDDRERFREWTEDEFTARTHHNLGRFIRNEWRLWDGNSALVKWFKAKNISHPYNMSRIILTSYYRHTHSQLLNLCEQISVYLEYSKSEDSGK